MFDANLLQQIASDDLVKDFYDRVRICLPLDIQKHYEYLLVNDDGTVDEHYIIEQLFVDVIPERKTPYYFFCFGLNVDIDVSDVFDCDYINGLVQAKLSTH